MICKKLDRCICHSEQLLLRSDQWKELFSLADMVSKGTTKGYKKCFLNIPCIYRTGFCTASTVVTFIIIQNQLIILEGNCIFPVVLSSSELGTLTLKKADDADAYIPSGDEEYGERYFLSEDDAKKYYEDYTGKAVALVKELLESQEWERSNRPESMASPEEINFDSGKIAFKKASYNQKGYLFTQGPSDDEWAASDHSGKYSLTVKDQRAKDTDSTPRPLVYKGELTADGASVAYTLEKRNDSLVLKLGETMYDPVFTNGK